jgi:glycosyltransferase involved in cell wall biosynthesis
MYHGKKIVVVMPAYNAARTVALTVDEVRQQDIVDEIILVDDRSRDNTVQVASCRASRRIPHAWRAPQVKVACFIISMTTG